MIKENVAMSQYVVRDCCKSQDLLVCVCVCVFVNVSESLNEPKDHFEGSDSVQIISANTFMPL